eukprot:4337036-Prymnesium_polylepis.1
MSDIRMYVCSKPPHPDLELHSHQENLPARRGGRSAPRQHDAHSDEANLNVQEPNTYDRLKSSQRVAQLHD